MNLDKYKEKSISAWASSDPPNSSSATITTICRGGRAESRRAGVTIRMMAAPLCTAQNARPTVLTLEGNRLFSDKLQPDSQGLPGDKEKKEMKCARSLHTEEQNRS